MAKVKDILEDEETIDSIMAKYDKKNETIDHVSFVPKALTRIFTLHVPCYLTYSSVQQFIDAGGLARSWWGGKVLVGWQLPGRVVNI